MRTLSKLPFGVVVGGFLALAVLLLVMGHLAGQKPVVTVTDPSSLPGMRQTEAPWDAGVGDLRARLSAIGLGSLVGMTEGDALHIHQHLDLLIDGKPITIPANIGISVAGGFISPIHVHDETGIIHVESPKITTFTLGQFFDVWGVRFTAECIGSHCAEGDKTVSVYLNGVPYIGDPRTISLAQHDEILVAYGTPEELPKVIPNAFPFPEGY